MKFFFSHFLTRTTNFLPKWHIHGTMVLIACLPNASFGRKVLPPQRTPKKENAFPSRKRLVCSAENTSISF